MCVFLSNIPVHAGFMRTLFIQKQNDECLVLFIQHRPNNNTGPQSAVFHRKAFKLDWDDCKNDNKTQYGNKNGKRLIYICKRWNLVKNIQTKIYQATALNSPLAQFNSPAETQEHKYRKLWSLKLYRKCIFHII